MPTAVPTRRQSHFTTAPTRLTTCKNVSQRSANTPNYNQRVPAKTTTRYNPHIQKNKTHCSHVRDKKSPLPLSSDTLTAEGGEEGGTAASALMFRALICVAPEAALIQTECDKFNGETKIGGQTNLKTRRWIAAGAVCAPAGGSLKRNKRRKLFIQPGPSLRQAR